MADSSPTFAVPYYFAKQGLGTSFLHSSWTLPVTLLVVAKAAALLITVRVAF